MRILKFEIRKTYFRRYILLALLLLSVLDIGKIVLDYDNNQINSLHGDTKELKSAYQYLSNKLYGELTEEKLSYMDNENRRLGEIYMMKSASVTDPKDSYSGNYYEDFKALRKYFYDPLINAYDKLSYDELISEKARANIRFYREQSNIVEMQKSEYISSAYDKRSINALYNWEGLNSLLKYDFSSLLIGFFLLFGVANVFPIENESDMNQIILSSEKGRKRILPAKISAAICFSIFAALWFSFLDLGVYGFLIDFRGVASPIFLLDDFSTTPLNCSVLYFVIQKIILRIIGFTVLSLAFLLCSQIFIKTIHILLSEIVLSGLFYFMSGYSTLNSGLNWAATFSPVSLIQSNELFKSFHSISIGRYTFFNSQAAIIGNLVLIATIILISALYQYRTVRTKRTINAVA